MPKPAPLFFLLVCLMLTGCSGNTTDPTAFYNKKANELMAKVIEDSNCSCLFPIPKRSLIAMAYAESLSPKIENIVIEKLKLRNNAELDSLANWSREFKLDPQTLKKNSVKIISLDYFWKNNDSITKICPKGVLSLQKPIFDRQFKRAVIDYEWAFSCMSGPISTFEFKNNQWTFIEN
ncbi:hypothetical protein GGR22_000567 [Flavobacterium gossypii]|uniref:Lipoprotein n=1 Tax=Flavobacterium gossypii TaxID=1646119 RepID=A0ABR6DM90_9FLAO|nr:hypothetical protein [Flavobacterium gossypii]MBA9072441.1 hypothetical protein [Flavobacterium gossypii]